MPALLTCFTLFSLAVLAYHYLGYPLLLFLWARYRPNPVAWQALTPPVSLIISAYNEAGTLAAKIDNSLALDYPKLEIIVVTDGSTDASPAIVARYAGHGVRGLHQAQRQGKAAAMNRAAAQASGDILLFSDANAFYLADAVRRLAGAFADERVGCASGRKTVLALGQEAAGTVGAGEGLYWRYESAIKSWESSIASTAAVVGEMIAIRRHAFQPIPAGVINDDVYLALRAQRQGQRVVYEPRAVSWERPSSSMRDERIRRQRMTAGRFQALFRPRWWPWGDPAGLFMLLSHKFLRLLLPFFMLGALLGNGLRLLYPPVPAWLLLTLLAQLGFYSLALLGLFADRTGRHWRWPAIAYYITNGNLGSLAGLARYLSGRQSVLWQKASR